MTVSILNDCLLLKEKSAEELQEYFRSINVDTFDEIFNKYPGDKEELNAKQVILFILCAHSEDSPLIVFRQDIKQETEAVCEYLQIPEYLRKPLIDLEHQDIRNAITSYVSRFCGPLFKSLTFMKIQLSDFERDITNRAFTIKETKAAKDDEPEITTTRYDSKEHGKAVAEYNRIAKQIDVLEREIKSNVKRMAGIEDIIEYKNKKGLVRSSGRGMSIENSTQF